jgi:GNAT superfamily N-acetyltransferase
VRSVLNHQCSLKCNRPGGLSLFGLSTLDRPCRQYLRSITDVCHYVSGKQIPKSVRSLFRSTPARDRLMLDRWFSTIKLPMSLRQFRQLPQNASYSYSYVDKTAWLSPCPKFYSARLELCAEAASGPDTVNARETVGFRRFEEDDWPRLLPLFGDAFRGVQPFGSLSDRRRLEMARACLKFTSDGNDGPLIEPACRVACGQDHEQCLGAILVTLIPLIDLEDFWSMRWRTPPPPDCIERRLGRPHLTWIFVGPERAGLGIGSALLAQASRALVELGYTELISSFLIGNTSSMLWHWRNGFDL